MSSSDTPDRWERIQNLYLLRDKQRRLRTLKFNPAQQLLADKVSECLRLGKPIRHMDLKARQVGASTFWLLYYLDDTLFTPNTITFIVAQKQETLGLLWDAVRLAYNNMPERYKPATREDSARTLTFDSLNSTIKVSLSVKSTTLHNLHVSEYALCDPDEIEQTLAACPPTANVTLETVANGVNHAYHKWNARSDGWTKVFHPWFRQPEYSKDLPAPLERTAEEAGFAARSLRDYGVSITDGQLAFRRQAKTDLRRRFSEQFAEDETTCFLASGQSFFDGKKVVTLLREATEHMAANKPERDGEDWKVWERPQHKHVYVIGADVADGDSVGADKDYSSMSVLCVTCRKTAARYTARCGYDSFYRLLYDTGMAYNRALLGWELNNHGHAVKLGLVEKGYPNLYRQERQVRPVIGSTKESLKFGWETNAKTKTVMMDALKVALEGDSDADERNFQPSILWLDTGFLEETLKIREVDGKISAMSGEHDDVTVGYAIAWQMYLREASRLSSNPLAGIHSLGKLESA